MSRIMENQMTNAMDTRFIWCGLLARTYALDAKEVMGHVLSWLPFSLGPASGNQDRESQSKRYLTLPEDA